MGQLRARSDQAKADRRLHILGCAAAVCAASGYDELTVADVAERAGVAKGTVFRYFPTKEDLGRALAGQHLARWADDLDRRLARLPGPPAPDTAARLLVESLAGRRDLLALAAARARPGRRARRDSRSPCARARAPLPGRGRRPSHAHGARLRSRPAGDPRATTLCSASSSITRSEPTSPASARRGNALASSRQATRGGTLDAQGIQDVPLPGQRHRPGGRGGDRHRVRRGRRRVRRRPDHAAHRRDRRQTRTSRRSSSTINNSHVPVRLVHQRGHRRSCSSPPRCSSSS